MKLYKNLTLMVLFGMTLVMLGMAAAANATAIDPGVGIRSDGASTAIGPISPDFSGTFPGTMCADPNTNTETPGITNCLDYFNNYPISPNNTFVGIQMTLTPIPNAFYTCDNALDPFFTSCSVSGDTVKFFGLSSPEVDLLSAVPSSEVQPNDCGTDGCQGIPSGDVTLSHFSLFLTTADTPSFTGVADLAVSSTPEPASVLLFVIAMGAIALFLKRA
jgi:hypothetical protein